MAPRRHEISDRKPLGHEHQPLPEGRHGSRPDHQRRRDARSSGPADAQHPHPLRRRQSGADFEAGPATGSGAEANASGSSEPAAEPAITCYSFGAHVVFRQGFKQVQIQGVEFADMGQAGKLGHYPVHFHMARQVPTDTFIKDSSINESMTRWIVLHSTQGVLLQRNVGYKSIGHGFYLESGTETDNKFYSNLGIFARAADRQPAESPQGPRHPRRRHFKPARNDQGDQSSRRSLPVAQDYDHPTVFWISNGWNDFIGNMAAGAGACGTAYWLLPDWNSDMTDVPTRRTRESRQAHEMDRLRRPAEGPQSLRGIDARSSRSTAIIATSTMNSFLVIGHRRTATAPISPSDPLARRPNHVPGITSFAPLPRHPTMTERTCTIRISAAAGGWPRNVPLRVRKMSTTARIHHRKAAICNNGASLPFCAVTVLDHFTSSFHWAETNFAAIWLRPQWYLVDNSVLTDVQNAGLSFITSGTYDRSRRGRGRLGRGEDQRVRRQYPEGGDKLPTPRTPAPSSTP